jgi:phosphoenolpyruvate synthase/pyruvate phosphate dikinase
VACPGLASTACAATDIVGIDAVIDGISRCWASLFNGAVLISRAAVGLRAEPAMAVIIQEMVPVIRSGETLTIDPVGRHVDIVRITAMFGRGEGCRTGPPDWDAYLVDRGTNEVVETRIGIKTATVVGRASGPSQCRLARPNGMRGS